MVINISAMLALFLWLSPAFAAELELTIVGITKPGKVYLAVFNDEAAYKKGLSGDLASSEKAVANMSKEVSAGSAIFNLNLEDGVYAIRTFIDTNRNGKLEKIFSVFPRNNSDSATMPRGI